MILKMNIEHCDDDADHYDYDDDGEGYSGSRAPTKQQEQQISVVRIKLTQKDDDEAFNDDVCDDFHNTN